MQSKLTEVKKKMDEKRKRRVQYWLESSEDDWRVANHLFEKGDYSYALFFGHLTIEKILKGIYVNRLGEIPPHTHRLVYLAEKVSLSLSESQLELLEIITDFNMEARYPDEKFSFKKRCTKDFTEKYLIKIMEIRKWLLKQILP
ncbi:MAG: HEPN domain-containing protein [Candidatus Brocadia sapporoensis]|nr:MAG: HEPN domain-containing protein [Candidatus Brocadia sapporoensis]